MNILVVDDEKLQADLLSGFLENHDYNVVVAQSGEAALQAFAEHPFQLVLLDQRMPDISGDQVLGRMKQINPAIRSIMITAYGDVSTAVRVMKLGADDFLEKPIDLAALLDKIQRIENSILIAEESAAISQAVAESPLPINIVGQSPAMQTVLSMIRRLAPTEWAVLIRGETGTGKELIARLIHLLSPRSQKPFVEVNCAAIPENLFESELFGHMKGAFTGATANRQGRFELANTGSLFLDEVGELPLSLQAKLLRALQENQVTRVGGEGPIQVDVRILAATNRSLKELVEKGRFREDLYYRLNVLDIDIPPLRERKEDIPALVAHFLEKYGNGKEKFSPEAESTLMKYTFPGNVRELEHIVQRVLALSRGHNLSAHDLPEEVRFHQAVETGTLARRLEAVEKEMLLTALERNDWVQTRAARSLGISERVLRYKITKYHLKEK
ncbi:MAG: sigma-54 dependent transcriptional regulator [Desulfobacterales bacterium]|nr:sigma-54 dependent transcriptional regulator [Desulfobacterales bacterium]